MPEGLRTSTAPTRAYELVHDIGGSEQARFAVLVDWSDIRVADRVAFEESRKELFELRQRHVKGFVANRLLRSLGDLDQVPGGSALHQLERPTTIHRRIHP